MLSISQFRILLGAVLLALALSSSLTADEVILDRRPYTAYDAIEEGYLNSEAQRMSLINSQLDTVDRLRPFIVPVQLRRGYYARDPYVEAVYAYGRRGLFGRRPAGYVVIRRAPVVAYQQRQVFEPWPYVPGDIYGYSARTAARQPIGHESRQTGPNRWEYRPLYADDAELDAAHDDVERGQLADEDDVGGRAIESRPAIETERPDRRPAASEPEELPPPRESQERRSPVRGASNIGAARDIARDEIDRDDQTTPLKGVPPAQAAAEEKQSRPRERARVKVPPPPVPDEGVQPAERATKKPAVKPDKGAEPPPDEAPTEGPLLQNPLTGTKEF